MVKPGKPKSKRVSVRLRHRIEKASAAKQRKDRKQAKKNPEWRSRLKKDPGIPNLFPYKDRLLAEIEEKKRTREEEIIRKKEEAKALRQGTSMAVDDDDDGEKDDDELSSGEEDLVDDEAMDEDDAGGDSNPMAALLASARARAVEYEENPPSDDDEESTNGDISVPASTKPDASRKAFTNLFQSVLSSADIILYVLDARDPMSTRSRQTERQIATYSGGSKRLVLILNKIDLVPPKVLKAWLAHLRRSFPTLPLRASAPAANARTFDHKALTQKATTETLLRSLKSYASSQSLKRALTVAVVGFPNVGKSSVINALTSKLSRGNSSACPVGAEAGVTTALREVKLDNKLKLLDSPGIVFPSAADADSLSAAGSTKETPLEAQARLILLNALPPKQIVDPIPAITLLLKRLSASPTSFQAMLDVYGLPPLMTTGGDMTTDFLVQVARKRGRLGKGGVPNLTSAAMGVVSDWRDGRIQGWVDVPSGPEDDVADKDVKEIVKGWGEEFKIEGLWGSGADEVVEDEEVAMET